LSDSNNNRQPIRLRPVVPGDSPAMFDMQLDPEGNAMAGTKPRTRDVFLAAWERNLADPGVNARVIEIDGVHGPEVIGTITRFPADGHDCIGYWIAREHWGKGVASQALVMFLREEPRRPLYATAARTNAPSHRILEKCGFRRLGFRMAEETERFLAREVAEFVLD
jgi:RimJ/RimL family protein N-acetyltransferase